MAIWRWERETRYYEASIETNLFGEPEVFLRWGRRGSPMGNCKRVPAASIDEAKKILDAVARKRAKRGYVRKPSGWEVDGQSLPVRLEDVRRVPATHSLIVPPEGRAPRRRASA